MLSCIQTVLWSLSEWHQCRYHTLTSEVIKMPSRGLQERRRIFVQALLVMYFCTHNYQVSNIIVSSLSLQKATTVKLFNWTIITNRLLCFRDFAHSTESVNPILNHKVWFVLKNETSAHLFLCGVPCVSTQECIPAEISQTARSWCPSAFWQSTLFVFVVMLSLWPRTQYWISTTAKSTHLFTMLLT